MWWACYKYLWDNERATPWNLDIVNFITQEPLTEDTCQSVKKRQNMQFEILSWRNGLDSFVFYCELVTGSLWPTVTTHTSPSSPEKGHLRCFLWASHQNLDSSVWLILQVWRNWSLERLKNSLKIHSNARKKPGYKLRCDSTLVPCRAGQVRVRLKGLMESFSLCEDNPFLSAHMRFLSLCRERG